MTIIRSSVFSAFRQQVWLLGMTDNINKDFRVKSSFNRDTETMKAFITQYIDKDNQIVTNAWRHIIF